MFFTFCPQCGRRLASHEGNPVCDHCRITYYRNSKPTAGILIVDGQKVLVARRGVEPHKGQYDIIGGFLEWGEHPEEGALREVKEETGLDVVLMGILGIYMDKYPGGDIATLNIYYIAEIVGGQMKAMDDVASLEWLEIMNLPEDIGGFNTTKEALFDLQKLYEHQKLMTN